MTKLNFHWKFHLQKQASLICVPRKSIPLPRIPMPISPITWQTRVRAGLEPARKKKHPEAAANTLAIRCASFWQKNNNNKMARTKFAKRERKIKNKKEKNTTRCGKFCRKVARPRAQRLAWRTYFCGGLGICRHECVVVGGLSFKNWFYLN